MEETLRVDLTFSRERDGWLYDAITKELATVKPRNRAIKLKQLLSAALLLPGHHAPTPALAPAPAATVPLTPPPKPTTLPAAVQTVPAAVATPSYGDGLMGLELEMPGV